MNLSISLKPPNHTSILKNVTNNIMISKSQ